MQQIVEVQRSGEKMPMVTKTLLWVNDEYPEACRLLCVIAHMFLNLLHKLVADIFKTLSCIIKDVSWWMSLVHATPDVYQLLQGRAAHMFTVDVFIASFAG